MNGSTDPTTAPRGARALSQRCFHRWLLPALGEWLVITGLFVAGFAAHHWAVWLLVIVLLGSRQHAIGVLGHDVAHFAAARSPRLNDLSGEVLCFWPLFVGLADFRRFHLDHHRHFNTDKDPELLFKHHWCAAEWALPTSCRQIVLLFVKDLLGGSVLQVVKAFWLMRKESWRSYLGPLLWWAVVLVLLGRNGLGFAAVIWVAALFSSFWGFFRLRTWTEHIGSSSTHRLQASWWQRLLIVPHDSWSHFEHHAHPAVPFWSRHSLREKEAATVTLGALLSSFESSSAAFSGPAPHEPQLMRPQL